ncbi:von Willebrand factor type A [Planctomycetales bacterium 10988]|nr:von Willebrand factor type A [Planctomycetales bacterium 10988]
MKPFSFWRFFGLVCLGVGMMAPSLSFGQGFLVVLRPDQVIPLPRPMPEPRSQSYKIHSLEMQAKIKDQVAQVQVSQTFENTSQRQLEVSFIFPIPYDGAIDQMTLMVDGKEFDAKLLPKDEAKQAYQEIVRKNKDPALLEWMGTGMFQTSVFPVPAGEKRTVTLSYSQILRKYQQATEFLFPLSTAKYTSGPVDKVVMEVVVESKEAIKSIYSPTHDVKVKRSGNKQASIRFVEKNIVPDGDFRIFYDVAPGKVGASLLSYRPDGDKAGYFLMMMSPQFEAPESKPVSKNVIFVIDRSGSMNGKKIEQARDALKYVLNNLREGDLFNIVAYDTAVESFRPELQKYSEDTRKEAIGFVEGIFAGGSTNINQALEVAFEHLQDRKRPSYLIFLTDGIPTAGETNDAKIVEHTKDWNQVGARMINLGVGFDVNSRLLDYLSRENRGQSVYVRPDEDLEASVSRLYQRISSPILTDANLKFSMDLTKEQGDAVRQVYPGGTFDLFQGEQLVVVGKYRYPGEVKVKLVGKVGEEKERFQFPGEFVEKSKDSSFAFVEKLWATRRIGEIIDQLDLNGQNEELVDELVTLSTKHGILTPYTSFLADENNNFQDRDLNRRQAEGELRQLQETSGMNAFGQRGLKAEFKTANQAAKSDSARKYYSTMPKPAPPAAGRPLAPGQNRRTPFAPATPQSGGVAGTPAVTEKEPAPLTQTVRQVGSKTFYHRNSDQRWVDSTVTEEMEKKAIVVEQYSDEYFQLASDLEQELAPYLALDEPLLVSIEGKVYQIDSAK